MRKDTSRCSERNSVPEKLNGINLIFLYRLSSNWMLSASFPSSSSTGKINLSMLVPTRFTSVQILEWFEADSLIESQRKETSAAQLLDASTEFHEGGQNNPILNLAALFLSVDTHSSEIGRPRCFHGTYFGWSCAHRGHCGCSTNWIYAILIFSWVFFTLQLKLPNKFNHHQHAQPKPQLTKPAVFSAAVHLHR